MLKIGVLVFFVWSVSFGSVVGFSNGNDLSASPIQGKVIVNCQSGTASSNAVYQCRDIALDTKPYDYFIGAYDPRIDRVDLLAVKEDGSSTLKTSPYNGIQGQSREAFNLWISTPFQKPLLAFGKNLVQIRYFSGGNPIQTNGAESFIVTVKRGPLRACQTAQYTSADLNDCSSQYSICQQFFRDQQYCQ